MEERRERFSVETWVGPTRIASIDLDSEDAALARMRSLHGCRPMITHRVVDHETGVVFELEPKCRKR